MLKTILIAAIAFVTPLLASNPPSSEISGTCWISEAAVPFQYFNGNGGLIKLQMNFGSQQGTPDWQWGYGGSPSLKTGFDEFVFSYNDWHGRNDYVQAFIPSSVFVEGAPAGSFSIDLRGIQEAEYTQTLDCRVETSP